MHNTAEEREEPGHNFDSESTIVEGFSYDDGRGANALSNCTDVDGVAWLVFLPDGSLSGHAIDKTTQKCYGVMGTEIACEKECSHGEDYKLLQASIIDFKSGAEHKLLLQRTGWDVAKMDSIPGLLPGWDPLPEDAGGTANGNNRGNSGSAHGDRAELRFSCETLKSDEAAEEHVKKFLPKLVGWGAIVNIGPITMRLPPVT
eukprot:jgi/Mesvir1/15810/Mv03366-RA.1